MWRVRRVALVGGALLVAALTACSSRTPRPAGPPALGEIPRTVAVERLHLPVERYMLSPRQALRFDEVQDAAVRACMRGLSAPYPAATRLRAGSAAEREALDEYTVLYRRYGLTDAAEARTWGYHTPAADSSGGTAAKAPKPQFPSAAARDVLTGVDPSGAPVTSYRGRPVPRGGCLGKAERLLGARGSQGPGTDPDGIVARIKADSFERSMSDPRVTKVFARWSACMDSRGFTMHTPMDEVPSSNGATPSRREIAQARADVACKARTDLVGIWFAVESAYQKAAIGQHGAELARVEAARDMTIRTIDRLSRGQDQGRA
ncbi:hypothetical protein Shyhy01_17530 [Streptomyces hygroscopicus subsp. hygroscopicus]|nr:hypothetical protein Shyhy01_17530 [Streptomyces hygroscopicus subsp. hygroscopicus]